MDNDNWIWTINGYFSPENAVKTPLKEQWIFFYSEKKENNPPNILQGESGEKPEQELA